MRKSRLFSLLCAFWPGAGEMYLGLMQRGLAIMMVFWLAFAIGATMFPWIVFIMPVLWFYSFFDTLTLRNLDYYALTELQERDEFFFQELLGGRFTLGDVVGKYHVALGIGLICAGLLSIYNRLLHWFGATTSSPCGWRISWITCPVCSSPSPSSPWGCG